MWLKLKQFALALFLFNSLAAANDITQIDGDWYSFKWKYGYSLSNGKGIAFVTNSPNFKVGQEIVRLTAVGKNSYVGENIYKDGKFYKVKVSLQSDGKLLFEGEKNVKWEMEKIDPETYSSLTNVKSTSSKPEKKTSNSEARAATDESSLLPPEGTARFKKLDLLEKFFITKNKAYWNAMQDNGGISGKFFGLSVSSAVSEENSLLVQTSQAPTQIRAWAERLCVIQANAWDIQRSPGFTSGNAVGKYCDASYQPLDDRLWIVIVAGPKVP